MRFRCKLVLNVLGQRVRIVYLQQRTTNTAHTELKLMELNSIFDCIVSVAYNLIDNVTNFMCYDKSGRSESKIIYFMSFEQQILHNPSRESCERGRDSKIYDIYATFDPLLIMLSDAV